jgi:hypothetical protein
MKFPKPWKMEQTGPTDCCVYDANDRKLFYIVGDEGDGEEIESSVLFWSDDDDNEDLYIEIKKMVEALK